MKEVIKQFKWLILCCLISQIIIYFELIKFSSIGVVDGKDISSWMGYYGSIFGGFMTLAGVWWTINDNNTIRQKELSIEYKPILNLQANNAQIQDYHGSKCLVLKLINIGRGEH